MIDYIKGQLAQITPQKAVIEVGGIGYGFLIPPDFSEKAPQLGETVKIFVFTVIREDSHRSYGFLSERQRELFETLLNVSGVGPKTAIAMVGHISEEELPRMILSQDVARLSKIPGIGKKIAEKICLELKGRWKSDAFTSSPSSHQNAGFDAIAALVNLGYPYLRAEKAVKKALDSSQDRATDVIITEALKMI